MWTAPRMDYQFERENLPRSMISATKKQKKLSTCLSAFPGVSFSSAVGSHWRKRNKRKGMRTVSPLRVPLSRRFQWLVEILVGTGAIAKNLSFVPGLGLTFFDAVGSCIDYSCLVGWNSFIIFQIRLNANWKTPEWMGLWWTNGNCKSSWIYFLYKSKNQFNLLNIYFLKLRNP